MFRRLLNIIHRYCLKRLFCPIRVFVFHHVSDECEPLICQPEDWTQLERFKRNIEKLQQRYTFISLTDAYNKLRHDIFRFRNYAVLTTDDGLACVLNVQPWLEERNIPLTLFVNTRYMEGDKLKPIHEKWLRELSPDTDEKMIARRMYLSKKQIWSLNSPLVEIGMHGHEHLNALQTSAALFEEDLNTCISKLHEHPRFIKAYAYPWGNSTKDSLAYLHKQGIIPVVVKGSSNYTWGGSIDRECIDNVDIG